MKKKLVNKNEENKALSKYCQHFFLYCLFLGYRYIPLKYDTKAKIKLIFFKNFPNFKKQKNQFIQNSSFVTSNPISHKFWFLFLRKLNSFLYKSKLYCIYKAKRINFKNSPKPLVSIIIPRLKHSFW